VEFLQCALQSKSKCSKVATVPSPISRTAVIPAAISHWLTAKANTIRAPEHLLGVSSGAALGAIIVLLHTGMFLGLVTVLLFAFGGVLLTTVVAVGVANLSNATNASRLVLTGVAISFVVTSLGSLGIFVGDPRAAHTVVFWMLGGLGLSQWAHYPLLALAGCGAYLMTNARNLNAMSLCDESATTLGIPAGRFRMVVFIACALLTGAVVAFSGIVSFVGLMIPHLVRNGGRRRPSLRGAALGLSRRHLPGACRHGGPCHHPAAGHTTRRHHRVGWRCILHRADAAERSPRVTARVNARCWRDR
jgi:ABC-type cobalamin transport system permease subunit